MRRLPADLRGKYFQPAPLVPFSQSRRFFHGVFPVLRTATLDCQVYSSGA